MIQRGEAFVRALDAESGSFGDKRQKIVQANRMLRVKEWEEEDNLADIERLSDIRRMTTAEKLKHRDEIALWIKLYERQHQEDEILNGVRMKRQRQAEWKEQYNRMPILTAEVYLDRNNVGEKSSQEVNSTGTDES